MMTSLSALTLEVYYRYLPLYKLDKEATTPATAQRQNRRSEVIEDGKTPKLSSRAGIAADDCAVCVARSARASRNAHATWERFI